MTYANGNYSEWAGRVYDGPLEGEYRKAESPYFQVNVDPRGRSPWIFDPMPAAAMEYYQSFYRWSNPLRAWVFEWPNVAPSSKKATRFR